MSRHVWDGGGWGRDDVVGLTLPLPQKRRIEELEDRVNRIVDARLQALEAALGQKIEAETGSWMLPFLLFAAVVGVAFVLAYRKYRYLIKQHLL